MTGRALRRWAARYEHRARAGWWTSRWAIALAAGGAIAAFVAWRGDVLGETEAGYAWLAVAIVATGVGFLRVPFHMYWRADAALLAQLPIEGDALFAAALARCLRAAAASSLALVVGALPLARYPGGAELVARYAAYAAVLGLAAGVLVPAVVVWAASVVIAQVDRTSAGTILGAIPGAAGALIIVTALVAMPWLSGAAIDSRSGAALGVLVVASALALIAARVSAPRVMATILRDVSALDRQRLAALDVRPPTALERVIGKLTGDAAPLYRKDARLMRRRYPMAFALGGITFVVLVVIALAAPAGAEVWLVGAIVSGAAYALVLADRLHRPPIELPRLAATLPLAPAAASRARVAWITGWWTVFVVLPAALAAARTADAAASIALAVASAAIVVAGMRGANRPRA